MRSPVPSGLLARLLGRPGDRQRGFAEAGVAVTGAALVLGAALGSGVASTVVSMSDGVTWLADDATGQVVQVNPATGRAERRLQVAAPGSPLEVSQRDGRLVVTDAATGVVTSIDLASLMTGGQRRTDEPARVLVGGGRMYLVTPASGVVRAVDPLTLEDLAPPHRLRKALADAVVDDTGTVWVVTTAGEVASVAWEPGSRSFVPGERRSVQAAGPGARLLPHARGVTVFAPGGGVVLQVGAGRDVSVAVPDLSGEVLPATTAPRDLAPAAVPARSAVVVLSGDRLLEIGVGTLGCERPGRPAVFAGLVHVPCTGAGRVLVLHPDGKRARPDVLSAVGRDPRLLVDDGRLVVHSEDGTRAVVVEADGRSRVIDTRRGDAPVHDPRHAGSAPVTAVPPRAPAAGGRPGPGRHTDAAPDRPAPAAPGQAPSVAAPDVPAATAAEAATAPAPDPTTDPAGAARPTPVRRPARPSDAASGDTRPGRPAATAHPSSSSGATSSGPTASRPTSSGPEPSALPTASPRPPAVPTGVTATRVEQLADGSNDVRVTWDRVTPAPDGYVVRSDDPGGPLGGAPASVEVAGDGPTSAVVRVGCGGLHTFEVVAVASGVASAPGTSRSVRMPPCIGPQLPLDAPTDVVAAPHPDGTVTVTWTPSPGPVESYVVGPVGGSTTVVDHATTSVVLRDVAPGEAVRFTVGAVGNGQTTTSQPSAPVTVAGPPGPVTHALKSVGYLKSGDRALSLTWSEPATNGSPVESYDVVWSGPGVGGTATVDLLWAQLIFSCAGTTLCDEGGEITATVTARNAAGAGPATTLVHRAEPGPRMTSGDVVVDHVSAGVPARSDPTVPMTASLTPPPLWAAHTGGCTLLVTDVTAGVATELSVPCSGGEVPLGGYPGGHTLEVAVRANVAYTGGPTVTSRPVVQTVPARDRWPSCASSGPICVDGARTDEPDIAVIPLRWAPQRDAGDGRPPLAATGSGLLLAAAALRATRLRRAAAPAGASSEGTA